MNIIQGSNNPIVCRFRGASEKIVMISAMLIQYSTTVKEWTTEDVTVDGDLLILPLTESDTMNLGNGNITLDIKGLTDDNRILFADLVKIKVCKRENNKHMTDQAGSDGDTVIDLDVLDGTVVRMSYSPYIGSNGNWFQYDDGLKAFFDTGVRAQGAKGDPGYTPIKNVDYFDGEPGIPGPPGRPGAPGDPGKPGRDGKDYVLTDDDRREIAEMAKPADYDDVKADVDNFKINKMARYILRLEKVGNAFVVKDYVTNSALTFDQIKTAVSNTANYVVCLYGNSKLRPQYVSTGEMMFIGLDRASAEAKVLRMLVTPTSVSYETYSLASKTDIVALQNEQTQVKESFTELKALTIQYFTEIKSLIQGGSEPTDIIVKCDSAIADISKLG